MINATTARATTITVNNTAIEAKWKAAREWCEAKSSNIEAAANAGHHYVSLHKPPVEIQRYVISTLKGNGFKVEWKHKAMEVAW
jgi:hypothetical protein